MIKFLAELDEGTLYGFALTEANLNRMEFNREPIFFDFGYAGHPELFGLFIYFSQFKTPEDIVANFRVVEAQVTPFLNEERNVTPATLRIFPLAQCVFQQLRDQPFWSLDAEIKIAHPKDKQLIFAGPDEQSIEDHFREAGLITPQTKFMTKGFDAIS